MTTATDVNGSKSPAENGHAPTARRVLPPVDIFENGDGFLITADLPGVSAETLTVEYAPPELVVRGKRVENVREEVVYERRFELGSGIDANSISAELKNGVLTIELKKAAALRPRKIEVRAA